MTSQPALTDRDSLARHRTRAEEGGGFLQAALKDEIQERLTEVNRGFTAPAVVTAYPGLWQGALPGAKITRDHETLPFEAGAHDLVIHALALHWANDPVGQLIQCRRALRPDGLLIAALFGGRTLHELRTALAEAEARLRGGLSPRVAPMGEIRDLGALLQRAGLALPVADSFVITAEYTSLPALARDLRAMGETNALAARDRRPPPKRLFAEAEEIYRGGYGTPEGRLPATFEIICLTGWAADASQPQPLRPGSAAARLADALGTEERPAGDPPPRTD